MNKSERQRIALGVWLAKYHHPEMVCQAEDLPLRRDMVTLLRFTRDNMIVGTRSTGNMPLKAVRDVTSRFVNPPLLDTTIGDRVYRLRSEADVWPVHFLHILAEVGGLLEIEPGRRWLLTTMGERFLGTDPLLQTSFLLTVWWYGVDWLVAFPLQGMGADLPRAFDRITLTRLRAQPVGFSLSFEAFADGLIEQTGLTWTARDVSSAPMLLRASIDQMVVRVLADFGAVERVYREEPRGTGTTRELVAIAITPFGKALLDAVADNVHA